MKTSKNMTNEEIAKLLRSVAAAYQVKGKGPQDKFRIIAYERAADVIDSLTTEIKDLWKEEKLDEIEGIGTAIDQYLNELFLTGKVKHFKELFSDLPEAMFELLDIPGLGAKRALKLTKTLGITKAHGAVEKLAEAAEKGRIREIEGFGEQSEKDIIEAIKEVKERIKRYLLSYALPIAEDVVSWMKKNPKVDQINLLGSLRRRAPTVGDIDIAVASSSPEEVIEHFLEYPKKLRKIEAGETTASILLPNGVQVDLMVQPPNGYGALLQHFTGSKQHNIALREYAITKGLSLSEHGIKHDGKVKRYTNEEDFYKALGMDWILPELRENTGEIQASLSEKLPKLIELGDIKGDLHMHSNFLTDVSHDPGSDSMEEMIKEAEKLGYEYIAFSEHNPKSEATEREVLEMLKQKKDRVEKINTTLKGSVKHIFNSLEIDIQASGNLALPEKAFDLLDFVIVSLHSSFRLPIKEQTKRILKGLEHPKAKIFGHPTGRKLNERPGVQLEWDRIFDFCKKYNKWLEINSWPERLDLPDVLVRETVKRDIKLVINTDSHAANQLGGIYYGVTVARRGWATKEDVVNTLEYNDIKQMFKI